VVYCEKVWMHPEEQRSFERETGFRVRPMLGGITGSCG
jgi:hypothetical protein